MTATAVRDDLPKLEKYELLGEIGHGGMATVYRARDLRLGREVAVKIIHRHLRDNREVATRFIAEGRAAAKLKHRGIVEVYDVSGEDERERYLVVELVRGPTLRQLLVDHRDLPAEIGAAMVIELASAIDHAHASGVIHRDIKPENVLVCLPARDSSAPSADDDPRKSGPASIEPASKSPKSGRDSEVSLKITDFGIAKILDAQGVTSTGQVLGSPAHMAPEQIEGGEVDPRTDVFALGVIFYECLAGHLPFDGKNPAQVLRRVLEGRYEPAERERPVVGTTFSCIADRALALDPKDRPDTPGALAALLTKELEALGLSDYRRELEDYFRDPDRYRAELPGRLVPVLVARAEAARRSGKLADAARDFNRAHALKPDDLHILKRMTQLARSSRSAGLPRKLALVAAASLGLGGLAYAIVRAVRPQPAALTASPVTEEIASVAATAEAVAPRAVITANPTVKSTGTPEPGTASASASASASARASVEASVPEPKSTGVAPTSSAVSHGERTVKFIITPRTAALTIDNQAVTPGVPISLKVGPHTAMITPQAGDLSCDPWQSPRGFAVTARGDGEPEEQHIRLGLPWRPAKVTLKGAPSGAVAQCGTVTLTPGSAREVPMMGASWQPKCKFIHEGSVVEGSVNFEAGKSSDAFWPTGG